jgi:hypothetical protein
MIQELTEDPEVVATGASWTGDWNTYVVQFVDDQGSYVDVTTGTLAITYTNVATGAAYSFGGGSPTLTKQYAARGIVSILNPAAYPTTGVVRITLSFTNGSVVRRFGPLEITVYAP